MASNILIACYSRNGSTEALARSIGEGAQAVGAEVRLRRARDLVAPEIIARAPGWPENAARMDAAYPPRPKPTPNGRFGLDHRATGLRRSDAVPCGNALRRVLGLGPGKLTTTPDDLEVARFQGLRVAQVAGALKAAGLSATAKS